MIDGRGGTHRRCSSYGEVIWDWVRALECGVWGGIDPLSSSLTDVDADFKVTVGQLFYGQSVIEVLGSGGVDAEDAELPEGSRHGGRFCLGDYERDYQYRTTTSIRRRSPMID